MRIFPCVAACAATVFAFGCQDVSQVTEPEQGLSTESGPMPSFGIVAAMGATTQITTLGGSSPAISGDLIVWADHRSGSEIYMFDLVAGTETQITSFLAGSPAISGNNIVYKFNGLMTFNSTVKSGSSVNSELAISGDRVVWDTPIVADGPRPDIVMFDLGTGIETNISNHPASQSMGAISGTRIVWADFRLGEGNSNIFMFDVATGTTTQITTDLADQTRPAISGDLIVWKDGRTGVGDGQIFMYDLSTTAETQITFTADVNGGVGISGSRIVWTDGRSAEGWDDVYMFDLATATETQITDKLADQNHPAISGDRIVWQESQASGPTNIYMFEIGSGPPTPTEQVDDIVDVVQDLLDDGDIGSAPAAELVEKLDKASTKLDQDQAAAAIKALSQFITKVKKQRDNGELSSADADALISAAQAAIVSIADAAGRTFVCHIKQEGIQGEEPIWRGKVIFLLNDQVPLHCSQHGKFNVTDHNPVIGNLSAGSACGRPKVFATPTCEVGGIGGSP